MVFISFSRRSCILASNLLYSIFHKEKGNTAFQPILDKINGVKFFFLFLSILDYFQAGRLKGWKSVEHEERIKHLFKVTSQLPNPIRNSSDYKKAGKFS